MASRIVSANLLRLMPTDCQSSIKEKEKERSISSQQHETFIANADMDKDESDIPVFLDNRTKSLKLDIEYHQEWLSGLAQIDCGPLDSIEQERNQVLSALKPLLLEFKALRRSKRGLSADIRDELVVSKRRKKNQKDDEEASRDILSKAYAKSIHMFTTSVAGSTKNKAFDRSKFKTDVLNYYDGKTQEEDQTFVYCQLTGPWKPGLVKAAHIVPKSFSDESVEFLFGSDETLTRSNPGNALLLLGKIEEILDNGHIAIVPISCAVGIPSRWKCILLDLNMRKQTLYQDGRRKSILRYSDIENKELQFRNNNRPARRFLYFRFVMSLLQAKYNGRNNIVRELHLDDQVTSFWASPGEYLRRSTLSSLTRNVSGLQLPEPLISTTTFSDSDHYQSDSKEDWPDSRCAIEMQDALSLQRRHTKWQSDDSEVSDNMDEDDQE